jgi:hypothetical protein
MMSRRRKFSLRAKGLSTPRPRSGDDLEGHVGPVHLLALQARSDVPRPSGPSRSLAQPGWSATHNGPRTPVVELSVSLGYAGSAAEELLSLSAALTAPLAAALSHPMNPGLVAWNRTIRSTEHSVEYLRISG